MKKHITLSLLMLAFSALLFSGCEKDNKDDGPKFKIGQVYGGGYVFYVDDSGEHGFICAPTDQATAMAWSNGSNITTGANGRDYGDGKLNTDKIVTAQGNGNYAAKICKDLVLNGYSDWYLPSMSEAFRMYFNMKLMNDIGDFAADEKYWSSTEATPDRAFSQFGEDGYLPEGGYYKSSLYHVRAIRRF